MDNSRRPCGQTRESPAEPTEIPWIPILRDATSHWANTLGPLAAREDGRGPEWWRRSGGRVGLALDLDLDLLADQDAAGLQRLVPGQAELLAVDLGRDREAPDVLAPRVGAGAAVLDGELDRLGDVADGEVTDEGELVTGVADDAGAAEGQRGELLRGEEVFAAQVGVAVRGTGGDALGLDRDLRGGVQGFSATLTVPENSLK